MKLKIMEKKKKKMSKYLKKFFYHTLSDLIKKLYYVDDDKIKNCEVIKHNNNGLIEFKNSINRKKFLETKILK